MIKEHIKLALEANHIAYKTEEDYFTFRYSEKNVELEFVIAWDDSRQIMQITVNVPYPMPPCLSREEVAHMMNARNCNADYLSVEMDESTLYCRMTTFLPDGRDAAVSVCSKALLFFFREAGFLIGQLLVSLREMADLGRQMIPVCEVKRILNGTFNGYVRRHSIGKEMVAHA